MQGWRDVARSTDERTLILSAHPYLAAGHKLPQIVPRNSVVETRSGILPSIINSFACDYAARQKVGGTSVTFFVTKQIPILGQIPGELQHWIESRVLELSFSAWDMAPFANEFGYGGPPFRWDDNRRGLLRAELDALMFHLYGINRTDTAYIMDTFPIVKRKDEKQHGKYRTKHLILDRYDAMTQAYETRYGSLEGAPNGQNPPATESTLAVYSRRLGESLDTHYESTIDPPPAHPSCAHAEATRPSWAT